MGVSEDFWRVSFGYFERTEYWAPRKYSRKVYGSMDDYRYRYDRVFPLYMLPDLLNDAVFTLNVSNFFAPSCWSWLNSYSPPPFRNFSNLTLLNSSPLVIFLMFPCFHNHSVSIACSSSLHRTVFYERDCCRAHSRVGNCQTDS